MKTSVSKNEFVDAFRDAGRGDNFTYEGLNAVYEYLEQLGEDIGEEIELDVIALCCEFTEYSDLEELQGSYPDIESIDELEQHTTVIRIGHWSYPDDEDGSFIIQDY